MDNLRMYLAPCRAACPIHMNCQGYVHLIAQGKEEEAAKEMRKDLPFAGIVGRVCTHPCEEKCERRKEDNQAVHIRALKRYLADHYAGDRSGACTCAKESGKRVAIVGSGPAGLMAAYELAAKGHAVTVFDSASEPGGMLRWGFRLSASLGSGQFLPHAGKDGCGLSRPGSCWEKSWTGKARTRMGCSLAGHGRRTGLQLGNPREKICRESTRAWIFCARCERGKSLKSAGAPWSSAGAIPPWMPPLTCRKLGAEEVQLICLEERDQDAGLPGGDRRGPGRRDQDPGLLGAEKIFRMATAG